MPGLPLDVSTLASWSPELLHGASYLSDGGTTWRDPETLCRGRRTLLAKTSSPSCQCMRHGHEINLALLDQASYQPKTTQDPTDAT